MRVGVLEKGNGRIRRFFILKSFSGFTSLFTFKLPFFIDFYSIRITIKYKSISFYLPINIRTCMYVSGYCMDFHFGGLIELLLFLVQCTLSLLLFR